MRNLLKYEMRALNRRLGPLYIGMLVMALLNHFFGIRALAGQTESALLERFYDTAPQAVVFFYGMFQYILSLVFFGLLVGVFVVWLLAIIDRFRKGLLGQEGYLMFTLPVSTGKLMGAKLLGASIHLVLAGLVGVLSIALLIGLPEIIRVLIREFPWEQLLDLLSGWGVHLIGGGLELILLSMLSIFASVLQFYFAMSLGHLSNKHRVPLSVLAYIALSTMMSMLSGAGMLGLYLLDTTGLGAFLDAHNALAIHLSLLIACLFTLVKCAIFWFGTRYILKNRLNLE